MYTQQTQNAFTHSNWVTFDEPGHQASPAFPQLESTHNNTLFGTEAHFRGIVDMASEAIISTTETGEITLFNRGAEQIFGYTASEIIGKPLGMLLPQKFRDNHAKYFTCFTRFPVITDQMSKRRTIYGLRKNGDEFPAEASISKIDLDGQMILTVVLRDITERKRIENRLYLLSVQLSEANQRLASLLKRFMPSKVAQRLINTNDLPRPGSEQQREATILFADMRNFTAAAEAAGTGHVLDMLNAYMAVINRVAQRYQGSVIQYVGDLVMVAFNVPDDQPDHPHRATCAALEMRDNIEHFISNQIGNWPVLRFGFGVHSGPVVTGYLGGEDRYVYAAVGDTTNVAFHICSQAQGGQIIISQTTLDLLGERANIKPLGTFPLKRRRDTYPMYQLDSLLEG